MSNAEKGGGGRGVLSGSHEVSSLISDAVLTLFVSCGFCYLDSAGSDSSSCSYIVRSSSFQLGQTREEMRREGWRKERGLAIWKLGSLHQVKTYYVEMTCFVSIDMRLLETDLFATYNGSN